MILDTAGWEFTFPGMARDAEWAPHVKEIVGD